MLVLTAHPAKMEMKITVIKGVLSPTMVIRNLVELEDQLI